MPSKSTEVTALSYSMTQEIHTVVSWKPCSFVYVYRRFRVTSGVSFRGRSITLAVNKVTVNSSKR